MSTIPRLVISAPSSGHGKTAVSVGLLAALSARGYRAAGFKIGPDHVDAAYLGLAAGRPGRNLDPRMVGAKRMGPLFAHGAASLDIAVVEGTMGLFDGLAGRTDSESTAQISGLLRAPVILVVDVGAMGQSVAALVHGFRAYDELLWLGGVILNRVASTRHEQLLREALDDIGVPVLGALRRHALTDAGEAGAPLPSRHHGVAPVVHHNLDAVRAVRRLGEVIAGAVDIDRTMALARSAPRLTADPWSAEAEIAAAADGPSPVAATRIGRRPVIGVAFAYPETAELLTAAGAEVVPFDPLRDEVLPSGVDGLVIGAALPESYAEELTFNGRLRTAVAAHAAAGKPIAAEGTGLVWLCRDYNGRPMCGVVDASARETDLVVLGYREATARSSSVLLPVGAQVIGHKMHRTSITPRAGLQAAWTWAGGPAEGFVQRGVHASYLGLHWAGTPAIAPRFVAAAGATAAPAPGQWSTPSTSPYGRPSVPVMNFPTAPVPSPSPAAAALAAAPPVPASAPVTGSPAAPASGPAVAAAATSAPAAPAAAPVTGSPVAPAPAAPAAPAAGPSGAEALAGSGVSAAGLSGAEALAGSSVPASAPVTGSPGAPVAGFSGSAPAAGSSVPASAPVTGSPGAPVAGFSGSALAAGYSVPGSFTAAPAAAPVTGSPAPAAAPVTGSPAAPSAAGYAVPGSFAGAPAAESPTPAISLRPSSGPSVLDGADDGLSYVSEYSAPEPPASRVPAPIPGSILASPGGAGTIAASVPVTGSYPVPNASLASPPSATGTYRSSAPASAPTSPGASSPFGPALGPAMPTPWTVPASPSAGSSASPSAPGSSAALSAPPSSGSSASPVAAPSASPAGAGSSAGSGSPAGSGALGGSGSPVGSGAASTSGVADETDRFGFVSDEGTYGGSEEGPDWGLGEGYGESAPATASEATSLLTTPGGDAAAATDGASVGVPSGPNGPAEASGLPSSGDVAVQSSSSAVRPVSSPSVTGPITAYGPGGVPAARSVSEAGPPASSPTGEAAPAPVSAPPGGAGSAAGSVSAPPGDGSGSGQDGRGSSASAVSALHAGEGSPGLPAGPVSAPVAGPDAFGAGGESGPALSAAMPVSSAPMPVFADALPSAASAPVSAAPGGVTAMPAGEPGEVGSYPSASIAGGEIAEQAPVSAPPVSAPPAVGRSVGTAAIPAAPVSGPVSAPPGSVMSGSVSSAAVSGTSSGAVSAPPLGHAAAGAGDEEATRVIADPGSPEGDGRPKPPGEAA